MSKYLTSIKQYPLYEVCQKSLYVVGSRIEEGTTENRYAIVWNASTTHCVNAEARERTKAADIQVWIRIYDLQLEAFFYEWLVSC